MLKNRYKETISIDYATSEDGAQFPCLKQMQSLEGTRLSIGLNKWIYLIVSKYYEKSDKNVIFHFYESDIGVYSTIDTAGPLSKIKFFESYTAQFKLKGDKREPLERRLYLIDSSAYFNTNKEAEVLSLIAPWIDSKDDAIICCDSRYFEESYLDIREILGKNKLVIRAIFCYENHKIYSKSTIKIDESTPLGLTFDDGVFYLVVVGRSEHEFEFVCEFQKNDIGLIEGAISNYYSLSPVGSMNAGQFLAKGEYSGPRNRRLQIELKEVREQLKEQNILKFRDLISDQKFEQIDTKKIINKNYINSLIFLTGESSFDKELFIDHITHCPILFPDSLGSIRINQKCLIFNFNSNLVIPEYLYYFLNSSIGSSLLKSYFKLGKKSSIEYLLDLEVPVPDLGIQRNIVDSLYLFDRTKLKFNSLNLDFKNCLFTKDGVYSSLGKVKSVMAIFEELNDYEKIKKILYFGESKTSEFKQTFCLDVAKKTKEKYIEDSCIKTIAAFLNSDGGTLLIGVNDNGEISGVDNEVMLFFKTQDKFLLHFKNAIKVRIGAQFYPFINTKAVECEGKSILMVECIRAHSEVYVDEKDFYVRTNPATDKLEGPKVVEYIRNHFKTI